MAQGDELLTSEIQGKLDGLKSSLRRRLAGEAVAWILLAMVGCVFVTLAFDYMLHMERPLRIAMMGLAMAGLAWTLWRQLVRPLCVPMGSEDLALLVEKRYTSLGDRLISAIQFGRGGSSSVAGSREMIRQMSREACELAHPLNLGEIVEYHRFKRMAALSLCAVALLGGFSMWQSDVMLPWLSRNLAFADVDYPQDTYLSVEGSDFAVLRGDDLEIVIDVKPNSAIVPPYVIIHARYESVGKTEERVDLVEGGRNRYVHRFQGVVEEFEFYVTGGDDRLDRRCSHKVTLIDPPALSDVKFVVQPPGYMNRPTFDLKGSRGVLTIPAASDVRVDAIATKDLRSVRIMLDGQQTGEARIKSVEDGPDKGLARHVLGRFDLKLMPGQESKSKARILRFALIDTDGYSNRDGRKYTIEVQADQAPTVELKKRAVQAKVTPNAEIPLILIAKDDCGIAGGKVLLAAKIKKLTQTSEKIEISIPKKEPELEHGLNLEPYKLKPGEVITVSVEVYDTLPADLGGPNRAKGGPLTFRIVKPAELMSELVQRRKAVRHEFVQAIALQESVRNMTLAAKAMPAGEKVSLEAARKLSEASKSQSSVVSECVKGADTLQAILDEMTCNKLGRPDENDKIREKVIQPLRNLAEPIHNVTLLLRQASTVKNVASYHNSVEQILQLQNEILEKMAGIRSEMLKLQTRQDMINSLRLILGWSREQVEKIKKARDEEIDVFDD